MTIQVSSKRSIKGALEYAKLHARGVVLHARDVRGVGWPNCEPVPAKDRIYLDQYGPTRSELFLADADGKNPRKLVPGTSLDYNASFSTDGQWVIFTSERTGNADLFRVHTDGTGLEQLTD